MYAGPKRSKLTLCCLNEMRLLDETPAFKSSDNKALSDNNLDDSQVIQGKFLLGLISQFHVKQGLISLWRCSQPEYCFPAAGDNVAVISLTLMDSNPDCAQIDNVLLNMATSPTSWRIKKLDHECFMPKGHVCFRHVSGRYTFGFLHTLRTATAQEKEAFTSSPLALTRSASPAPPQEAQKAKAPPSLEAALVEKNAFVDHDLSSQSSEPSADRPCLYDLQLDTVVSTLSQLEKYPSWPIGEISITSTDIKALFPGKWLSNGVLDPYFLLIEEHANRALWMDGRPPCVRIFPTYFLKIWFSWGQARGYTKRRDQYKQAGDDEFIDLLDLDTVVFLFHLNGNHWSFLLVSICHRRCVYCNSIRCRNKAAEDEIQKNLTAIKAYLREEVKERPDIDFDFDGGWEFHKDQTFLQQVGGIDCGVFLAQGVKVGCLQEPTRRWRDI